MLIAKPIDAFRLGHRTIIICQLLSGSPMQFLDQELRFYVDGQQVGQIKINGVSAASDSLQKIFDFSYSGYEILKEKIHDQFFIADRDLPADFVAVS